MRIWTSASMWIFTVSFALQIVPAGGIKYTHRPMNGYYCSSAYMTNYTAIGHQSCVAHCITNPHCWVLAYNSRAKYCLLGTLPCAEAVAGDDFRMMTFRKHENISCIQWVWSDGTSYPSRTVKQVHPLYQALARKPIQGEIYIGRSNPGPCITNVFATRRKNLSQWHRSFQRKLLSHWLKFLRHVAKTLVIQGPGLGKIFLARNGAAANYRDYYLLVVSESCSVAWVPYTAGMPLPRGTVEGGYLELFGATYCMRVWNTQAATYLYGYYAHSSGLGYYAYYGSKTTTQMDVLVQIHWFLWNTKAYIDWTCSSLTRQDRLTKYACCIKVMEEVTWTHLARSMHVSLRRDTWGASIHLWLSCPFERVRLLCLVRGQNCYTNGCIGSSTSNVDSLKVIVIYDLFRMAKANSI